MRFEPPNCSNPHADLIGIVRIRTQRHMPSAQFPVPPEQWPGWEAKNPCPGSNGALFNSRAMFSRMIAVNIGSISPAAPDNPPEIACGNPCEPASQIRRIEPSSAFPHNAFRRSLRPNTSPDISAAPAQVPWKVCTLPRIKSNFCFRDRFEIARVQMRFGELDPLKDLRSFPRTWHPARFDFRE